MQTFLRHLELSLLFNNARIMAIMVSGQLTLQYPLE